MKTNTGFTFLEMLVTMGIIAILSALAVAGYSRVTKAGENARAHELVQHVATAFTALFNRDGVWPKEIRNKSGSKVDEKVAWYLRNDFSVHVADDAKDDLTEESKRKTIGFDRFGIVTPWATAVIKNVGTKAKQETHVMGDSLIRDHILRYAVDLDGDGIIENVKIRDEGDQPISVRATAIVWCCNRDGKIEKYAEGVRKDGIYSWSFGQTRSVK